MKLSKKVKSDLDKKFQKVSETPMGFNFFVAIHDFVKYIELNKCFFSQKIKSPDKYKQLKKVYQGLEDTKIKTDVDLGHERYMTILELNKIKNKDVSENNSFWKKRELFRKLTGEVYEILSPDLT